MFDPLANQIPQIEKQKKANNKKLHLTKIDLLRLQASSGKSKDIF
jgi:hypothetical protein